MPIAAILEEKIEFSDDIDVSIDGDEIEVSGPNGTISKKFTDRRISIDIGDETMTLSVDSPSKEEKALLGTYTSHLKNMVTGAEEDFEYKMKVLYSHFPMQVNSKSDHLEIENFIGEEEPRSAKILGDTGVNVDGDEVIITGPDREDVAQTAANIEAATKIKKTDTRVFQDGIYIVEKAGKSLG